MNPKILALSAWPNPTHFGIPIWTLLKTYRHVKERSLPRNLLQYMAALRQTMQYKFDTLCAAVNIAIKCMSKLQSKPQLVGLTAMFIASKICETNNLRLNQLHKFSSHSFTNKDILKTEHKILITLNFNVHDRQQILDDYVKILYLIVTPLMPPDIPDLTFQFLSTTESIQLVLMRELKNYSELAQPNVMAPAIVVTALIILSQANGRFPLTCRLSMLTKTSESDIQQLSLKILKIVLGKNIFKELNF